MSPPADAGSRFARDAWIRALARAGSDAAGVCLPLLIDRLALQFDAASALVARDGSFTYRNLAIRCNQYARWGLMQGWGAGDAVSLMMTNCSEYLAVWLGLTRIGVAVALVNTHLAGEGLANSILMARPKAVIVGGDSAARLTTVIERLPAGLLLRVHGTTHLDIAPIEPELAALSGATLDESQSPPPPLDATALYIYTSGTTGLPKAAKVSHYRITRWSLWFAGLLDTQPQDRMYDCLPLYHSVGGVVAVGATLVGGGAVVIRPRFSASDFWRDVREEGCTLFQYIGELCRYLVNAPRQEDEAVHSLRIACGNGLRPEVWETFQDRFKIPRILEYYASTEGNFSLYNCEGRPGAIGRIPSFLAHRLPVALLRIDIDSGEPVRNAEGLCVRCAPNEAGEAVGSIPSAGKEAAAGRFEGYSDAAASARKILRDVFAPGDAWYRTGDLMRCDEGGFYYFVDRIGDTYRWKGENVSTTEVLTALLASRGVLEGAVYGVTVPGADGRAGMAALVVDADFDLETLHADVAQRLPAYARPVFLRLPAALEVTGTFKLRKQDLAAAGFDPSLIGDSLYFDDPRSRKYVPLDASLFADICAGKIKI